MKGGTQMKQNISEKDNIDKMIIEQLDQLAKAMTSLVESLERCLTYVIYQKNYYRKKGGKIERNKYTR